MLTKRLPPLTGTGTGLLLLPPFPSWPPKPAPQQYALESVFSPHVKEDPAAIVANTVAPETRTRVSLLTVDPLPRSPEEFSPAQNAAPVLFNTHVCADPLVTVG
jgi:hypothetical protein